MSAIPEEIGYTRRTAAGAQTGDVVPVPGLPDLASNSRNRGSNCKLDPTGGEPMPRLSVDLPLHGLNECHACGEPETMRANLGIWQECDEADVPQDIYLVLCRRCSDQLIEPHDRLYHLMARHQPAPGAMPICTNCRWQAGTLCHHPRSRLRGGPGVRLDGPPAHWTSMQCAGKNGRREHRQGVLYTGPVWGCDQKVLTTSRT